MRGNTTLEYPVRSRRLGGLADAIIDHGRRAGVARLSCIQAGAFWERHRYRLAQATAYATSAEEALKKPIDKTIVAPLENGNVI